MWMRICSRLLWVLRGSERVNNMLMCNKRHVGKTSGAMQQRSVVWHKDKNKSDTLKQTNKQKSREGD